MEIDVFKVSTSKEKNLLWKQWMRLRWWWQWQNQPYGCPVSPISVYNANVLHWFISMTVAGRCLRPHAVLQGLWKSGVRRLHQLHWRKQHKQQQRAIFLSQLPLWSGQCQEKPHSYKRIVGTTFYILVCFNAVSLFSNSSMVLCSTTTLSKRLHKYIYICMYIFFLLFYGCNSKSLNNYKRYLWDLILEYSLESATFIKYSMKFICRNVTPYLNSWYHNDGIFKHISLF